MSWPFVSRSWRVSPLIIAYWLLTICSQPYAQQFHNRTVNMGLNYCLFAQLWTLSGTLNSKFKIKAYNRIVPDHIALTSSYFCHTFVRQLVSCKSKRKFIIIIIQNENKTRESVSRPEFAHFFIRNIPVSRWRRKQPCAGQPEAFRLLCACCLREFARA